MDAESRRTTEVQVELRGPSTMEESKPRGDSIVETESREGSSTVELPGLNGELIEEPKLGIEKVQTNVQDMLETIVSFNINGLREKMHGLNGIKYFEQYKPTVICIQEHKVLSHETNILNGLYKYRCADRCCRDNSRASSGGSCILVRNEVWDEVECLESDLCQGYDRLFEVSAVKIKQNLVIISVYSTVRDQSTFIKNMEMLFNKLKSIVTNENVVITGDFNFKTVSKVNGVKRTSELANKFGYDLQISEPTTKKGSCLDNFVTNFIPKNCMVLKDTDISDHYPIILYKSVDKTAPEIDADPQITQQRKRVRSLFREYGERQSMRELYYKYGNFYDEYRKSQGENQEALDNMTKTHQDMNITKDRLERAKGVVVENLPEGRKPRDKKASDNHDERLMKIIIKEGIKKKEEEGIKKYNYKLKISKLYRKGKPNRDFRNNPRDLTVFFDSQEQANILLARFNAEQLPTHLQSVILHSNVV